MINQSILDEVANKLEQHEKSTRIKKLIFCASKNIWQNDQNILDSFKLQELIQELYSFNPTIEHWNYSLSQIVNTLNKPGEYSIVANVILEEVGKLYNTPEEDTGIIYNPYQPEDSTELVHNKQSPPEISLALIEELKDCHIKNEYNQFDLRQNIMKYTNPLRAKIVLSSALGNPFSFQLEDWAILKQQELDNLLWQLFNICPTLEEFEIKLNHSLISLGNQDENIQAAGAILQSVRSLYRSISSNQEKISSAYTSQVNKMVINSDYQLEQTNIENINDENPDNNTCQLK
jgi:hypothetical protein